MPTDTSEKGLETRICNLLQESGWLSWDNQYYNAASCVDLAHLAAFLNDTQPETAQALHLDQDDNTRQQFLQRLHRQISSRGIIDVLRNGIEHRAHSIRLFYGTPSQGNESAAELNAKNRFSVTRQVHYSPKDTGLSLDLVLFINGLPILTFELKNNLTKQTAEDAVKQYMNDRDPREDLFRPGRCAAHMAVDENKVRFCAELAGQKSVFLPFDQGHDGGAGNPPNPQGLRTDYLWQETLTPDSLTGIIENYAQQVGKKQIWPRYHQLEVVRQILRDVSIHGAGRRYLIQHSAGSGKSNSIAWLARQLIGLQKAGQTVFDSTIIVTDRVVLDSQISETVRQFTQVSSTVGHRGERPGPPPAHHRGKEDCHHHRPEIPSYCQGHGRGAPGPEVRHHHRRGPFQPGRPRLRRHERSPGKPGRRRRGRGHLRGPDQPDHREPQDVGQRQLLRFHRHP